MNSYFESHCDYFIKFDLLGSRDELNVLGAASINTLYGSITLMILLTVFFGHSLCRFEVMEGSLMVPLRLFKVFKLAT
jgi:hypothetical protein